MREILMVKHLGILLVLSSIFFFSAQACYRIPTKTENAEIRECTLMQINESTDDFAPKEIVCWYLAVKDLIYREIVEDGITQKLVKYYAKCQGNNGDHRNCVNNSPCENKSPCENELNDPDLVNGDKSHSENTLTVPTTLKLMNFTLCSHLVLYQAETEHPAYNILSALQNRLPNTVVSRCEDLVKEGYERIRKELGQDMTEQYWQERVAYHLNYIIFALARFFQDCGYSVDWEALGILNDKHGQLDNHDANRTDNEFGIFPHGYEF